MLVGDGVVEDAGVDELEQILGGEVRRRVDDLPSEVVNLLKYMEETVKCPVVLASVGPGREETLEILQIGAKLVL